MYDCNTPLNNLTYCDLNPVEQIWYHTTAINPFGIPNWYLMLGGTILILLLAYISTKATNSDKTGEGLQAKQ